MKIGIDARLYGTAHGGIGRYSQELINNLLRADQKNQYVFFIYDKRDEEAIMQKAQKCKAKARCVHTPYRWYSLKEQVLMPRAIRRARINVMHFTHFNVPLLYKTPPSPPFVRVGVAGCLPPFVVTIHDLIIHHFPDERATTLPKWLYRIKIAGYKAVMRHAVEKARIIIAPSEATKRDLLRFYKIDEKKIKVVYEGVSELGIKNYELRIAGKKNIQNSKPELVQVSNLNQQLTTNYKLQTTNYLLYVGSFYPHKNIERLIDAFNILRTKYNLDLKLVLVGKKDYFQKQAQKYLATHCQLQTTHCIFYGLASDDELSTLYQNAALCIFPSLYEGFGLPPLEAMQFGVPVLASNTSSIPEICNDAAMYFNPENTQDIAEKINTLYINSTLQNELRKKGYTQIKSYSWEKMAKRSLQIYENVI